MQQSSIRRSILLLLLIIQASPVIAATPTVDKFMLLYSNNVNGEIEPCG